MEPTGCVQSRLVAVWLNALLTYLPANIADLDTYAISWTGRIGAENPLHRAGLPSSDSSLDDDALVTLDATASEVGACEPFSQARAGFPPSQAKSFRDFLLPARSYSR